MGSVCLPVSDGGRN